MQEIISQIENLETKPVFEPEGNFKKVISTGSTLLDLAISGGRRRGGGIPTGIFVEIYGPEACVDESTEYFSPTGWKKICEYKGELILQYHLNGKADFVLPKRYIVERADYLYQFKSKYGVNQCLSLNHNILYKNKKRGSLHIRPFYEIKNMHERSKGGFYGGFISTFTPEIYTKYPMTDAELRVMVMVIADGTFSKRNKSNYCNVRIKKHRKITRAHELLKAAEIKYKVKETKQNFHIFSFLAPKRIKYFDKEFFRCSVDQLKIIFEEVFNWDGNQKELFFTTIKESADFIQYVISCCGKRGSITIDNRLNKPILYVVRANTRIYPGIENPNISIKKIKTVDEKQYCFEVPSGFLVLRRNNCIFISGNSGKTAILAEICTSIQSQGGEALFLDVEGRLDKEYARIYGVNLDDKNLKSIQTIEEFFETIREWKPDNKDVVNGILADSLAALALEKELIEEDKMSAARRANRFSEGLRVVKAIMSRSNQILVCSNQVRETIDTFGHGPKEKAPGGRAIAHYASLRIRVSPAKGSKIEIQKTVRGNPYKKIIGILSECTIAKSTVDDPYRKAEIPILFNYGIDDVRGNLEFLKKATDSFTVRGVEYGKKIDTAIQRIEEGNLQAALKEEVIDLWKEIEESFKTERKPKER